MVVQSCSGWRRQLMGSSVVRGWRDTINDGDTHRPLAVRSRTGRPIAGKVPSPAASASIVMPFAPIGPPRNRIVGSQGLSHPCPTPHSKSPRTHAATAIMTTAIATHIE